MNDLAIAIRAFNRPHYLKEELASLEAVEDVDKADFHLYQGKGINKFSGIKYAEPEEINGSLELLIKSHLPNRTIYEYVEDVGNALEELEILRGLFPLYEYVVLIDDDLVFNKYYIRTLRVLFEQFADDPQAGMIQTSYKHEEKTPTQTYEEAKKMEDKVAYGFSHRWEQGFWKKSWEKIRPCYESYCKMMEGKDFIQIYKFNQDPKFSEEVRTKFGGLAEDEVLEKCAERVGYRGIHTLSLRHKTIGKQGAYSFSDGRWGAQGFDRVVLHELGDVKKYILVET